MLTQIQADGLEFVSSFGGKTYRKEGFDSVVLVYGSVPQHDLYDQLKAEAHRIVDEAEEIVIIGIFKDRSITRANTLTDSGSVSMMGALQYQIHRIKMYLDYTREQEEAEE